MDLANILGSIGVVMCLLGFVLNLTDKIDDDDLFYIIFNLIGGILTCISACLINYIPFKKMSYLDSIENDKFKIDLAKDSGFDVLVIWSDTPVEENIEICKYFITNKLNNYEIND